MRLVTINTQKLTTDPLISLWMFTILSQVQILFSLVAVATPALKKTMMDLVTNYGAAESQSNTARSGSFPLKYLSRNRHNISGERSGGSKQRSIPFSGPGRGSTMVSRSRNEDTLKGDSDSQEGIIRHQDFEVSFYKTDSSEEVRDTERGYGVAR